MYVNVDVSRNRYDTRESPLYPEGIAPELIPQMSERSHLMTQLSIVVARGPMSVNRGTSISRIIPALVA